MISAPAYELILEHGIQLIDRGDGTVDLTAPTLEASVLMGVRSWTRTVGPAAVDRLARQHGPRPPLLLIAPTFSVGVREVIDELGWSWIATGDTVTGRLRLTEETSVELGTSDSDAPKPGSATRGRRPRQRHAVVRHLLLGRSWTQSELVQVCQVTQPRVSQVLKELADEGLVSPTGPLPGSRSVSWGVTDAARLFDSWLSTYPGPGGSAPTYWFGLESIEHQARTAWAYLDALGDEAVALRPPIVSGDAAADYLAPYRRSHQAVIYSPRGADLGPAGFTPSPRHHATLKLVVPTDSSVWPHDRDDPSRHLAPYAPFPMADPLQVAWDLLASETADADQAVEALKRVWLLLRADETWR